MDGNHATDIAQYNGTGIERAQKPGATGLVLEGGGLRGIYTAGILDVFAEHGITFDGMAGVSAGAIHGSSFMANQPGRGIRFYLAYSPSSKFMGLRSLITTGDFINYPFCYQDLPDRIAPLDYDAFEKNPMDFYMVCSDVERGTAYYGRSRTLRGHHMQLLRASASLPVISRIVSYDGHMLLDGGTADSIPVDFLRSIGYTRTVVVLTQVAGYRKKKEIPPFFRTIYKKYPAFIRCMETRYERYNATLDQIERLERSGDIFVFRPSHKVKISRLERDTARILEMYELGRHDALQNLEAVREFLQPPQEGAVAIGHHP